MKYSYNLISKYIDGNISKEDMIGYLDLLGLNPMITSQEDGDVIFEIETPANRGYLLSLLGIAREILPFCGTTIKIPDIQFSEDDVSAVPVNIENGNDCLYYSCRVMKNIHNSVSPEGMKQALLKMGYRTSFNTVDISNFVMAEIGQPLHIFDLDKIEGYVEIRRSRKGESAVLIDGKKRQLDEDILVIADAVKIVAIAGIMGCEISEVKEDTKNILIESAVFNPSVVRKGSKKLGLTTEASLRFERGMDVTTAYKGMARATYLVRQISNATIGRLIESVRSEQQPVEIALDVNKVSRVLGIGIEEEFISKILKNLNFTGVKKENSVYLVKPPYYRNDIKEDIDIIEEIARYWRYSEIPSLMPQAEITPTLSMPEAEKIEKIKDIAVKLGFTEFINMGITDRKNVEIDRFLEPVAIKNPISINLSFLRTSLIPEILESIRFNIYRGSKKNDVFEIGQVYCQEKNNIKEKLNILFGIVNNGDFFTLKGKTEKFLQNCVAKKTSFINKPYVFTEDGSNAAIVLNNADKIEIGNIFIPSDRIKTIYDIEKEDIYICEIYLWKLMHLMDFKRSFTELPRFPSSSRDFSFVFSYDVNWKDIENTILSLNLPIEKIEFFDTYTGGNIGRGNISISFSVLFRHPDRTLEKVEVKDFSERIIKTINLRLKGELRSENTKY